ncbi:S53 family peptidase [Baekduia sp.]|jgi:subtilase family serine protease|uniref:S53 family peptidase n=1 Tax=Baekduia sp. TaxID=2600305 RepID=UPI002E0A3086|nr:S53 family peptidase [Baekduia sp.]
MHRSLLSVRSAVVGVAGLLAVALPAPAPAASSPKVDYGPISHQGLASAGPASNALKLTLQLGLIANQSGLQSAVKAASNPASSSYGKYPSLSTLASSYGASSSKRNAVANAFKRYGVTAKADVTHLRMSATISIGNAEHLFGTSWTQYRTGTAGQFVVLPTHTPKLPSGLAGNVDTIAGMRLTVSQQATSSREPGPPVGPVAHQAQAAAFGGTPTRTGTPATGCLASQYPLQAAGTAGLMPNQILSAYGIAPLQASGLLGQGVRLAIVGEAPTPAADVNAYRSCFGVQGTALAIHGAGAIQPILESSLDAMIASTVAPQLAGFDLWVSPLSESADDGDVLGFLTMLAAPLQATASGHPLPDVVSVSYGECESTVAPYTASRTIVERELTAMAALGITVVVAAGDTGSSACARGVPAGQLTSAEKQPQASWPATSPWVLAVGGTNLTLDASNAIASSGPWNDTVYAAPYTATAGGGGGQSTLNARPWWQTGTASKRRVPDVAAFGDAAPGYPIICSSGVQKCGPGAQSVAFVGGTSAATPLVAGMIALWTQQARAQGLPRLGFVAPLLYLLSQRSPGAFLDITQGTNALFGGSCCAAGGGYDMATGLGSPRADQIAGLLATR